MKKLFILTLALIVGSCAPPKDGENGVAGSPGVNGHSLLFNTVSATSQQCTTGGSILIVGTDNNSNGALDDQDSLQSVVICNGTNGKDAPQTQYTPVKIITPCGPDSSPYKEVLLVLADGSLFGSFSDNINGLNTRLALIPDGSYIDTDVSHCAFTVTTTISHSRTVYWVGGQESWNVN